MWLRKSRVPGSAPGGLVWGTLEDVVEVPDELGLELLSIRDAGFSEAPAPTRRPSAGAAAQSPDEGGPTELDEAPATPRRGRPRRTTEITE